MKVRPDDAELRIARGRQLAVQHKWQQAASEYESVEAKIPPRTERFEYACLLLLADKQASYEDFVKKCAADLDSSADDDVMVNLAEAAAIGQQQGVAPDKAVQWARSALEGNSAVSWRIHALALALYRAGKFDEAINHAKESNTSGSPGVVVRNWLIIAMAAL